jgi:hypothetical protein
MAPLRQPMLGLAPGPYPKQKPCFTLVCALYYAHTRMATDETPEDVRRWFLTAIQKMWPVAEGSLSLRRSPCIRKNCSACARGQGHQSYILYGRSGSRRLSMYVPDELAKEIQAAINNGRNLRDLTNEAGRRYLKALKAVRRKA